MVKCCVEGCVDVPTKDITYFNFPASRTLRRKWIAAISPSLKPKVASVVCSRHFQREDCESARGRTRLRSGAVPSVFDQTNKERRASTSSDDSPISELADTRTKSVSTPSDSSKPSETPVENHRDETNEEKTTNHKEENEKDDKNENGVLGINLDGKKTKLKGISIQKKRKNLHDKLKSLHNKHTRSKNVSEATADSKNTEKVEDVVNSEISDNKNEHLVGESSEKVVIEIELEKSPDSDASVELSRQREGDEKSGGKEKDGKQKSGDSQDESKSSPKPQDTTIDKPEDIEELLTNYTILQDRPLNIHTVSEAPPPEPSHAPVFIEISVDKDKSGTSDKGDCLMVMESVEVELDPSELMLPDHGDEDMEPVETVEIEDTPAPKDDPISLLTSSDEDDVILEEPHIDTVEVSDETDEDDVPLVKLLKRRRAEKKSLAEKKKNLANLAEITPSNGEDDLAKILWGMYEYYCVQCHYTTSSGSEYRRHTASHAKVLMMCQICGYMTASETQFTKHEKQHGEKKYRCHLCSYKAKHNMSLLYHLKGHKAEDYLKSRAEVKRAPVRVKVFECEHCEYVTKKRCDLKRHMSRRHKKSDDEDFVP